MRTLSINKKITDKAIKTKMKTAKSTSDFKRWQIIHFVFNYDVDAAFLADTTGYSKASVYSIVQQFNNEKGDISTKIKGGRRRSLITVGAEKTLMKGLEEKALQGQILSFRDIKKIVEVEVGKEVSDDYLWDLFKRNGWTKHSPRPHHPNKDTSKQEEFKKNSKTIWMPLKMILANHLDTSQ
jgi:transposase